MKTDFFTKHATETIVALTRGFKVIRIRKSVFRGKLARFDNARLNFNRQQRLMVGCKQCLKFQKV